MEHFFSPNSSRDLHSGAHQSQTIEGDAEENHTQIVGGIQSNCWGDIPPPDFRHLCLQTAFKNLECICGDQVTALLLYVMYNPLNWHYYVNNL